MGKEDHPPSSEEQLHHKGSSEERHDLDTTEIATASMGTSWLGMPSVYAGEPLPSKNCPWSMLIIGCLQELLGEHCLILVNSMSGTFLILQQYVQLHSHALAHALALFCLLSTCRLKCRSPVLLCISLWSSL